MASNARFWSAMSRSVTWALERGEVSADTDVMVDLLFRAVYHRLLQFHRRLLTDRFARRR